MVVLIWISKDRRDLLKMWVQKGEDKKQVEAEVVVSKSKARKSKDTVEFLSIREMINRKFPASRIQGIINQGGGVKDEYAPEDPSLVSYWVRTARKRTEVDEEKVEANMRIGCDATPSGIAALMNDALTPGAPGSSSGGGMTAEALQQLQASIGPMA